MMSQTKTANPILVLEEVEKAGGSQQNGTAHHVMLTMVERETAINYWDKCLLTTIDLSHVCWLMTCNDPSTLPATLLSRLDVVQVEGPTMEHFNLLLLSMTAALARSWNVAVTSMPKLPAPALDALEKAFAQSRSARRLRRHLESVFATLVPFAGRPTQ
jgi:ATP-dependent Lon protease